MILEDAAKTAYAELLAANDRKTITKLRALDVWVTERIEATRAAKRFRPELMEAAEAEIRQLVLQVIAAKGTVPANHPWAEQLEAFFRSWEAKRKANLQ